MAEADSKLSFQSPQLVFDNNISTTSSPLRTTGVSPLILSPSRPSLNTDTSAFEAGIPPGLAESTPLAAIRALQGENPNAVDPLLTAPSWALNMERKETPPLIGLSSLSNTQLDGKSESVSTISHLSLGLLTVIH